MTEGLYELPYVPLPDAEPLGPLTVTLADVSAEPVEWLWPGRLPLGKLVVLDGDPAVGKSTLAVDLAARVSRGTRWPDGAACSAGDALILSAEDGLADTIRPRLDAAEGDPAKVHALTEVRYRDNDGQLRTRPPTLGDAQWIEQAIRRHHARLVIIDVLMAYLPGKVDSHRDQDIRSVLSAVAAVAERTGCCVLLLRHLNKASGGNPLYRGGGSIGIVGAARAAFLAAVDPDDDTRRVLAATKANLAPMPEALAFRLVDAGHGCARVQWDGGSTHSAADLLGHRDGDNERGERDEAAQWLLDYLDQRGGHVKAGDVIKAAAADGIAKTTLTRARQRARVATAKSGMHDGWVWSIDSRRIHEDSEETSSHGLNSSVPSVDPSQPQGQPVTTPPLCESCVLPLDPVLSRLGERTHPTCRPWLPHRMPTPEQVYATAPRSAA